MGEDFLPDSSVDYDVIVVGAGLAGLAAARELLRNEPSLRVLVVEAKERIGGRILTVPMRAVRGRKIDVDLGGTIVRRTQENITRLIEDFRLETFPQYTDGLKWGQLGVPQLRPYTTRRPSMSIRESLALWWTLGRMEKLAEKVDVRNVFSWSQADELNETTLAHWIRENAIGRSARDAIEIASRSTYGIEPNRINLLYHLAVCKSTGLFGNLIQPCSEKAEALQVKGGAQQICTRMADEIGTNRILLNRAVNRFDIDEALGITRVHTYSTIGGEDRTVYTCSQVICAIPWNQCRSIMFSPSLPHLKERLFESTVAENLIKFVVTYETAFWRKEGWSGEMISTGRTTKPGEVLPVICTFDYTSPAGDPAIMGFINEEYADMTKEDRCNAVVQDLMRVLGERAMTQFVDYQDKVWSKELFSGGSPSSVMPYGTMDSWQTRQEPFLSVHFAGTETASQWIGYMDGAVESGVRTAHEVLHQLGHHDKVSYKVLEGTLYDSEYQTPRTSSNHYVESSSYWPGAAFFLTVLCIGIFVYSRKYRLSYTARVVRPLEKVLVKFSTGIDWPGE